MNRSQCIALLLSLGLFLGGCGKESPPVTNLPESGESSLEEKVDPLEDAGIAPPNRETAPTSAPEATHPTVTEPDSFPEEQASAAYPGDTGEVPFSQEDIVSLPPGIEPSPPEESPVADEPQTRASTEPVTEPSADGTEPEVPSARTARIADIGPAAAETPEVQAQPPDIPGIEGDNPRTRNEDRLTGPDRPDSDGIVQTLVHLINDARQQAGIPTLENVPSMQFAAAIRAQEALESLSHSRPDGTPYHSAFDEAGFPYAGKWHGENLAVITLDGITYDDGAVAAALLAEWAKSPGHERNMLDANFTQTGVGVYVQREGNTLHIGAAQLFASP